STFLILSCLECYSCYCALHSFPTRRSSDLERPPRGTGRAHSPARGAHVGGGARRRGPRAGARRPPRRPDRRARPRLRAGAAVPRSEEHTSELQSRENLVCRLLLEKKKTYEQ